ncbi:F-box domain-containing protein [Heracleum sosnowskyi]|uniref:F-box domain-containing protein n=1 Tax=Heracleum sosnowskyi TaxID=360622 RepID=A0AAD8J027_9APIA|nr:F-box domain-containing protein [Heracleum sosnowskyi]
MAAADSSPLSIHSDLHKNKHDNIYMLVRLYSTDELTRIHLVADDDDDDEADLVLYRIDPNQGSEQNSESKHLHDLRPLLVFPCTSKEQGVSCVKFGSKLYFFGLDYCFSLMDFYHSLYGPTRVHVIEEKDLMSLEPSDKNYFSKFRPMFSKTKNPMHDYKYAPICFVADNKLYVLSRKNYTDTPFEVFCPVDETWQALPSPYDVKKDFNFKNVSHNVAEKEHMVYFATSDAMMSFNLETRNWTFTSALADQPVFRQATLVGRMAFGFLDHPRVMSHVSASKPCSRGEEVMQPYLAPDPDFLKALRSSRFTYVWEYGCTGYIVVLQDPDDKEVVCFVTYGSNPPEDWTTDFTESSYVALSFFRIPGDFYTSENRPDIFGPVYDGSYADEKAEDGGVMRRYFSAKYLYTKHFLVNNSHLNALGKIVNCFL